MRNRCEKDEQREKNNRIKWVFKIIKLLLAYVLPIVFSYLTYKAGREGAFREIQKEEVSLHPHFVGEVEKKVSLGREDCYEVYLWNANDDVSITNGSFGFNYIVIAGSGPESQTVLVCEDVIAQTKVEYNSELKGCFVLVGEDCERYEKYLERACERADADHTVVRSYIFFCFQYVYHGEQKKVYYLLELPLRENQEAVEPKEPDEYMKGIRMEL